MTGKPIGKSLGGIYATIAMCKSTPNYRAIAYFASNESRKSMLHLANSILLATNDTTASIGYATGNIKFDNGSLFMLKIVDSVTGYEAHSVTVYDPVPDWMYEHLMSRERLK